MKITANHLGKTTSEVVSFLEETLRTPWHFEVVDGSVQLVEGV